MWRHSIQDMLASNLIELPGKIKAAEFAIFTRISSSLPDEEEQKELFEALSQIRNLRVRRICSNDERVPECVSLPIRNE
jgi:hypothetical protein